MTTSKGALAVIIGRADSKGLHGKNSLTIAGRPMIAHTIAAAQNADSIDRIIVSTDGSKIAAAAHACSVQVVDRPPELADDHATVDSAVRHAVESISATNDIIVILYANVPVRPPGLIDRAVNALATSGGGGDSVQSYCAVGKHHPHWMVRLDESQRVEPFIESSSYRRQDLPDLFIPDGGVIAVTRQSLFTICEGQPHAFLGGDRRGIITQPGEVVDVDTPSDFAVAEALLNRTLGI